MSHWSRRCNLFYFQGNSICLVRSHPDRQHRITLDVFQNDNGSTAVGIHHQRSDFDLDFHTHTLLPYYSVKTICLGLGYYYVDYVSFDTSRAWEVYYFMAS